MNTEQRDALRAAARHRRNCARCGSASIEHVDGRYLDPTSHFDSIVYKVCRTCGNEAIARRRKAQMTEPESLVLRRVRRRIKGIRGLCLLTEEEVHALLPDVPDEMVRELRETERFLDAAWMAADAALAALRQWSRAQAKEKA